MQLETGIEGHSHWPSVGDFYSVTEDLEWQNQNILWRQKPGEVEKVRVKTCIGNTTMLRMQFVNRSRVLRLNEIQKNNRIRTASSWYDNICYQFTKLCYWKSHLRKNPPLKPLRAFLLSKSLFWLCEVYFFFVISMEHIPMSWQSMWLFCISQSAVYIWES